MSATDRAQAFLAKGEVDPEAARIIRGLLNENARLRAECDSYLAMLRDRDSDKDS